MNWTNMDDAVPMDPIPAKELLNNENYGCPQNLEMLHSMTRPATPVLQRNDEDSCIVQPDKPGAALILDVHRYKMDPKETKRRYGSHVDVDNLSNVLNDLGCTIFPMGDIRQAIITKQDMMDHISAFKNECKLRQPAFAFIFIGSHGEYHDKILTSDDIMLDLHKDIVQQFSHKSCPQLEGIPKIFLVQACQSIENTVIDSTNFQDQQKLEQDEQLITDTLVCNLLPGQKAKRSHFNGSFLVQYFTDKMTQYAPRGESILTILKMVGNLLEQKKIILSIRMFQFRDFCFSAPPMISQNAPYIPANEPIYNFSQQYEPEMTMSGVTTGRHREFEQCYGLLGNVAQGRISKKKKNKKIPGAICYAVGGSLFVYSVYKLGQYLERYRNCRQLR